MLLIAVHKRDNSQSSVQFNVGPGLRLLLICVLYSLINTWEIYIEGVDRCVESGRRVRRSLLR